MEPAIRKAGIKDPAWDCFPITPDDNVVFEQPTRGISWASPAQADIEVVTAAGNTRVIPGLAAGVIHPIQAKQVRVAGTTAQQITGYL
jgi:hypothetical protein